jgi:hypothetical protein
MNAIKLVPIYLRWHYTTAIVDLFRIDGNIFWFLWHFFSVPETFRTFFSPWQRMNEGYKKGFDIENIATTFVTNSLMRIVGVVMRSILLFFALVSFFVTSILLVLLFIIWIFMPVFLIMLAFFGISALFN